MSVVTLQNAYFTAAVAEKGAELKSLKETAAGIEYIWQADPAVWAGSAPILFPIVGGLKDSTYYHKNAAYNLPGHGFVRGKTWTLESSSDSSATFRTDSDESTWEIYPFDFTLRARFALRDRSLDIEYEVTNASRSKMYFSIGSHPAFNLPFAGGQLENYYVHFSDQEHLEQYFFKDGMHLKETEPVFNNSHEIYITRTLFDRGPVILKNPVSKDFYIKNSRNAKQIRVSTDAGVPFLAVWSKPAAPFVCIEPWFGVPDPIDTDQEFTTKEGIMSLERGCVFKTKWSIDILG